MNRVKTIKKSGSANVEIMLDNEERLELHEDLVVEHRIVPGRSVERHEWQEWTRQNDWRKGYHRLMKWLSRKSRSIHEAEMKLEEWEFPAASRKKIIHKSLEEGYLDDYRFAEQLAQYRFRVQKKGQKWIEYELQQKRVDSKPIEAALASIDSAQEKENATAAAWKKWRQVRGDIRNKQQKVGQYLLRRGYSANLVQQIVYHMEEGIEEDHSQHE